MRRLQYRTLISTSMGALHTDSMFLVRNRHRESVTSESRATIKVTVDKVRPITVRYWKCHPYASLLRRSARFSTQVDRCKYTHDWDCHACYLIQSAMFLPFMNLRLWTSYFIAHHIQLKGPNEACQTSQLCMSASYQRKTIGDPAYMDQSRKTPGRTGQPLKGMMLNQSVGHVGKSF